MSLEERMQLMERYGLRLGDKDLFGKEAGHKAKPVAANVKTYLKARVKRRVRWMVRKGATKNVAVATACKEFSLPRSTVYDYCR